MNQRLKNLSDWGHQIWQGTDNSIYIKKKHYLKTTPNIEDSKKSAWVHYRNLNSVSSTKKQSLKSQKSTKIKTNARKPWRTRKRYTSKTRETKAYDKYKNKIHAAYILIIQTPACENRHRNFSLSAPNNACPPYMYLGPSKEQISRENRNKNWKWEGRGKLLLSRKVRNLR